MQLEQRFTLPAPPTTAWPAFQRIELLVECLPGASLTGPDTGGDWPLRLDVKLGPIAAGFVGTGRVSADDAAHSGRFEGSATDKRTNSRVKGAALFRIEADGAGSLVIVDVDYTLTGTLAQFNRGGLVRELASALTAQFAANLSSRLQASAATAETYGSAAGPASGTAPADASDMVNATTTARPMAAPSAPAVVPLDGLALLRQMLKARWRRLLDRWRGRASV